MAKIDPLTKEIADYILSQVEYEIDEDEDSASMAKLMHLKLMDASAKIIAAQSAKNQELQFKRLADNVHEMYNSHIIESNSLMRQALMIFAQKLDADDGRTDILALAEKMAGRSTDINLDQSKRTNVAGDNVVEGDQQFGDKA